jgi:ADP-ribose pyrophosphatase
MKKDQNNTKIERPLSKQPLPNDATLVFKGKLFDVYQWEQRLYNGTKVTFEKIRRPDTAIVFPVLPDGTIMLSRQEQPGKKAFIGAFGGRIEEGEDPIEAAKRELLEESGYEAGSFTLWKAEQPYSKIEWAVYVFIAHDLKRIAAPSLDGGEKIEPFSVSFDTFLKIATDETSGFSEREVVEPILEALLSEEKMKQLRNLFTFRMK